MTSPGTYAASSTTAVSVMEEILAHRTRTPPSPEATSAWAGQSLATGAAGTALLHIERAHAGRGSWRRAHAWISCATRGEISAADRTGLYLGATAVAMTLHAAADGTSRYQPAIVDLDRHVQRLAHRRVTTAMTRIQRGGAATFGEYDLFYGLTGIGAHLLHRHPGGSGLERVLHYLVALIRPRRGLPGWWVDHDPRGEISSSWPGGHANLGAAHGITGPLLLLCQAARRGLTVGGQLDAINEICAWLDRWRQDGESGAWWPECITLDDLHTGRPRQPGPARPSWCYGTPGIARAGQLAGIVTGDPKRKLSYETALTECLADPAQARRLTEAGLCHGAGGVYQTTWRAARDAETPELRDRLPAMADLLLQNARRSASDPGFLDGDAGAALALNTAATDEEPTSGWDACLLID